MEYNALKTLGEVVPIEFHREYRDTRAFTLRDCKVIAEYDSRSKRWPGTHKNVLNWWQLEDGRCVGWNENAGRGWSFPVYGRRTKSGLEI